MALAVISLVLTIFFGVFDFQRIELTAKEPAEALYLENSDYRVKGLPTPVAGDLELDSSGTLDLLLVYLKTRLSQDREDQQSVDEFFRKMRQREAHNTSPQTLSHLLTMHAETLLLRGEYEKAVGLLEEARELWRDNPWATVRLYRTCKALLGRYQDMSGPWSVEEQSEVRRLIEQIEELEGELVRLGVARLAALGASGDSEINIREVPKLAHFATHGSIAFEVSARERTRGLLNLLSFASGEYPAGESIQLTANPGAAWEVDGWSGTDAAEPFNRPLVSPGESFNKTSVVDLDSAVFSILKINNLGSEPARRGVLSVYPAIESWGGANCASITDGGCSPPPAPEARARVVSIGVDAAGPLDLAPLTFAAADARKTAQAFEALGFDAVEYVNGDATRDTILWDLADEVLASQPGDELVVYYSGHGFTDAAGDGAVVTDPDVAGPGSGVNPGGGAGNDVDPGGGVLYLRELEAVLSHHRGKVTVIVDACLDERDIHNHGPRVTGPLGNNRPTIVLASGAGRIAIESNRLGGGVFTYALDVYLRSLADADPSAPVSTTRFDVNDAFDFLNVETARLAITLHGVDQRPELLIEADRP